MSALLIAEAEPVIAGSDVRFVMYVVHEIDPGVEADRDYVGASGEFVFVPSSGVPFTRPLEIDADPGQSPQMYARLLRTDTELLPAPQRIEIRTKITTQAGAVDAPIIRFDLLEGYSTPL